MALTPGRNEIGVQTSGTLVRPFKTDLPDPGAALAAGGNRLGGAIYDFGFSRYKAEAETAAKDAANSVSFEKDENGNLIRPPSPDSYGFATKRVYDEMLDARYVNTVMQNAQAELNKIHAENINDPALANEKMQAHVKGVLGGMDPKYAGQLQAPFQREINERTGQLLRVNAERDRSVAVEDLNKINNDLEEQARNAYEAGDDARGDEILARRARNQRLIAANHAGVEPGTGSDAVEQKAIKAGAKLMAQVRAQIGNQIQLADIENLQRIIASNGGEDARQYGIDQKWLDDNVPNARQREVLIARLERMKTQFGQIYAAQNDELRQAAFERYYDKDGGLGYQRGVSRDEHDKRIEKWAQRNNVDTRSPAGIRAMVQKFGIVPEPLIRDTFANVRVFSPDQIERRYQILREMENGQSVGNNGSTQVGLQHIPDESRAFLSIYGEARAGGADPLDAKNAAESALRAHVPVPMKDRGGWVLNRLKEEGHNDTLTMVDVHKRFDTVLGKKFPTFFGFSQEFRYADLPREARDALISGATVQMAQGVPVDKAIEIAGQKFAAAWKRDPTVATGFVRREAAPPEIIGVDRKPETGYVKKYVDLFIDPQGYQGKSTAEQLALTKGGKRPVNDKAFLPDGTPLPGEARFLPDGSGDIKLLPQGNGTFGLVYTPGGNLFQLRNKDGNPIVLDLNKAASLQQTHLRAVREKNDTELNRWAREAQQSGADPSVIKPPQREAVDYATPKAEDVLVGTALRRSKDVSPRLESKSEMKQRLKREGLDVGGTNDGTERLPDVESRIQPQVRTDQMVPELKKYSYALLEQFPTLEMTSGYRSPGHNHAVGGARRSKHMDGSAADFSLKGLSLAEKQRLVRTVLANADLGGIGYYPGSDSIHIDFRQTQAAWGPSRRRASLVNTPTWFREPVLDWLNG